MHLAVSGSDYISPSQQSRAPVPVNPLTAALLALLHWIHAWKHKLSPLPQCVCKTHMCTCIEHIYTHMCGHIYANTHSCVCVIAANSLTLVTTGHCWSIRNKKECELQG